MHARIVSLENALLDKESASLYADILKIRKHIFVDRYGWKINTHGLFEQDQHDIMPALHIVVLDNGKIISGMRLSPTIRENFKCMIEDMHPNVLPAKYLNVQTWETSRFFVNPEASPILAGKTMPVLLHAMAAWGIMNSVTGYVGLMPWKMVRVFFERNGCAVKRISDVTDNLGSTNTICWVPVNFEILLHTQQTDCLYSYFDVCDSKIFGITTLSVLNKCTKRTKRTINSLTYMC